MKSVTLVLIAGMGLGAAATAVHAEDVWVKSPSVDIRSGKGAVFPVVVAAKKGAKLTVLAHEGRWLKVQAGSQEGYIFEGAISAEEVEPEGGAHDLLMSIGGNSDAQMSQAAAGKGLDDYVETFASGKNLDKGPLNHLITLDRGINPQEWQQFTAAGKVGPDAPNNAGQ